MLPVLHLSGRFRFFMPGHNNAPEAESQPFDPAAPRHEVISTCWSNPDRYLQFELFDTTVRRVSHPDGKSSSTDDAVLGARVSLQGLFPDVSPSAIGAQLFAATLTVGAGAVQGEVSKATQSSLRLDIRSGAGHPMETLSAHLRAVVEAPKIDDRGSPALRELASAASGLELYLHLNRYSLFDAEAPDDPLTGDVFGFLRPVGDPVEAGGSRRRGRKLVVHPDLTEQSGWFYDRFLATGVEGPPPRADIEGFYDVSDDARVLTLHYLGFVPHLHRGRETPALDRYEVVWEGPAGSVPIGELAGTHAEMVASGGLVALPVPDGVDLLGDGKLAVIAVRGPDRQPLMVETVWDLVLESDRGLTLSSGGSATLSARVYRDNRPVAGHPVRLSAEEANARSPIVARFVDGQATTDASGLVQARVIASDLARMGGAPDPVAGGPAERMPLDRYCGNYLFLEIDNPLRRNPLRQAATEVVEVAVRVLHRIRPEDVPAVPSFERDVRPLFSYYLRYFPWLHVRDVGGRYEPFLDLGSLDDVRMYAEAIVARLSLPDSSPFKMPRSRDFPEGGVDVIRRWIDTGKHE